MNQLIIFTDSEKIAYKYKVSKTDVLNLIHRNIDNIGSYDCLILDASDYKKELSKQKNWEVYKDILLDFYVGMGIMPSPEVSLYILGGDDVVPMPRVINPIGSDEEIHCDLLYCFKDNDPEVYDITKAICNVGRLPMENGLMPVSFKDDIQSYFNLISMFLDKGIEVNSILMTSTETWLPASNEMIRDLPISKPRPIDGATLENMYVSPELDSNTNNYRISFQYKNDIGKADMLLFNLHGSDAPSYSSFYGEGATGHNTPEAFSIGLIPSIGARIFNTVACYGARFIGYNRNESMLLKSIYGGGVVLYVGSCVSALGRSGIIHNQAHDILVPVGMSESLMKLYSHYLISGLPAGVALLKAKCDYFNTCRTLDGDECALATILMFNLYGLPVLKVAHKPTKYSLTNVSSPKPISIHNRIEIIYSSKSKNINSILDEVRSKVDRNINIIKEKAKEQLYRYWGLPLDELDHIEKINYSNGKTQFRFEYRKKTEYIQKRYWAFIDNKGNVNDVIHFK